MAYIDQNDYWQQKVQRHLMHSCDAACIAELFDDDEILSAEILYEDVLDAEEIG